MNSNATPSSANDLATSSSSIAEPSTSRTQDAQSPAQKRAHAQTKKKYEFVNGLMTNLDVLIYVELCILYYMDCSLFRLILRVLAQMMFLTPKPNFIPPMPQHRPYIGAIFGPNIICFCLHIFTARSEAGEAMRGYLHGGVIIDLIGQKGPTSRIHLVLLDVLVLVLQCFMLSVHVERERLASVMAALVQGTAGVEGVPSQDHDAEERGVMREGEGSEDIEMQAISSRAGDEGGGHNQDRERLLAEPPPRQDDEDGDTPLDSFWSGTAIVADFHVLSTLRKQWDDYGNASASALQTVGFSAEFAALSANRRINAAGARFQRNMEALGA